MKKLLLCVLIALVSSLVAFASGQDGQQAAQGSEGAKPAELWIVYRAPIWHDRWIAPNAGEFQEMYPHISLKFQHIPHAEYTYKLQLMFASGDSADVVDLNLNQNYDFYASQDLLTDLLPMVMQAGVPLIEFEESIIQRLQRHGGLHMMPAATHPGPAGLFYNKTIFDEVGVSYPSDSWTYDDLTEAALKLTERDADGRVTRFGTDAASRWSVNHTVLHSFGGGWIDVETGTRSLLLDDGTVDAYQWLYDLYHTHQVSPQSAQMVGQNRGKAFAAGQTAMRLGGAWELGNVRGGMAEGNEAAVGLAPIGPAGRVSSQGPHDSWAIPKAAANPEAAWLFVNWLMSDEMLNRVVAEGLGLSTKNKINEKPEFANDPWLGPFIELQLAGNFLPPPIPGNYRSGEMRNAVDPALDPVWLGELPLEEGLQAAHEALQAVLDKPAAE